MGDTLRKARLGPHLPILLALAALFAYKGGFVYLYNRSGLADAFSSETDRVAAARTEKLAAIQTRFANAGLHYPPDEVFLRIFKEDKALELWAKDKGQTRFTLLQTYPICSSSGEPGPKRQQGDRQVPEGFYSIQGFNPKSAFWLSMQVNYPNEADKIVAKRLGIAKLGGDIFIHGSCATIGCIPITDDRIKELYPIVYDAAARHKVTVHIFPTRLNAAGLAHLRALDRSRSDAGEDLLAFWENLKGGYEAFEKTHSLPPIRVTAAGMYAFE